MEKDREWWDNEARLKAIVKCRKVGAANWGNSSKK